MGLSQADQVRRIQGLRPAVLLIFLFEMRWAPSRSVRPTMYVQFVPSDIQVRTGHSNGLLRGRHCPILRPRLYRGPTPVLSSLECLLHG